MALEILSIRCYVGLVISFRIGVGLVVGVDEHGMTPLAAAPNPHWLCSQRNILRSGGGDLVEA